MTPSFPTLSMASAIRLPMVLSLLEAMVATWAISFLSLVDLDIFFSSSTTFSTAWSMPRWSPIGFAPAVRFLSSGCSRSNCGRAGSLGAENAENVVLLHDQVLLAVQGDLAAGILAEQHAIPRLDVERGLLAVLVDRALANREDFAFLRLLLRAVGDDETAAADFSLVNPLDQDAVVERVQCRRHCLRHGAGAPLCQVCVTVTIGGVSGPNASLR